ncbi:zinc finger MYM-type protein 5-like [Papaver somniferum]|uniref:zinc finger MYM-type protein 5-like n=1 Tax=Papaver somniferum TaxID=3469 RepID=UPI000E701800|nr:zinc finger MYM-type protein 5-like [Papaver somniferum]
MGQELLPPNTIDIQPDEDPNGEELSSSDTNEIVQNEVEHEEYRPVNIYDPGNWRNNINRSLRDILVKKGPIREIDKNFRFPIDKYNRCYNDDHYIRKMENGESWDRKWLVYSSTVDKVFCFCCKLFKQDGKKFQLDTKGSKDWKNITAKHSSHKTSLRHIINLIKWVELENRLLKKVTIDKEMQEQIKKEKDYWKQVLIRIVSLVKTLAKNNLDFRGDVYKIGEAHNGNFLSFIEIRLVVSQLKHCQILDGKSILRLLE